MNAELSVADLRFAYTRVAEELFDGLTHRFTPGAVTALTGPSGRGKSTLLYVLGLMLTPSAGVVRLSHVLEAMGVSREEGMGALRITLGRTTEPADVERVLAVLPGVVERARAAGALR